MDVVENVVGAEAVVARALRAVAELQLRIRDVGAAADRALVTVALALLLALRLTDGVVEVRRLLGPRLLPLGKAPQLRREEHKEVQQRHERQHHADPIAGDGTEEDDVRFAQSFEKLIIMAKSKEGVQSGTF